MDPEIVSQVRAANEACMQLVTLAVANRDHEASILIASDPAYSSPATTMAITALASSAIRTIAQMMDTDPLDVVQVAALSAAQMTLKLEGLYDEDE